MATLPLDSNRPAFDPACLRCRYGTTHTHNPAPVIVLAELEMPECRHGLRGRCHYCDECAGDAGLGAACPWGDPTCPCQDGYVCHYRDDPDTKTNAMPCPRCKSYHREPEDCMAYKPGRRR